MSSKRRDRMNQFSDESDFITAGSRSIRLTSHSKLIDLLISVLIKFGILKEDFDYHLIRAAIVIIFVFFWISKMVGIRGAGIDFIYQQRPADLLVVPGFWHPRHQLVFRNL